MKVIVSELVNSKEVRKGERLSRYNKGFAIVEEEKWRFLEGNITELGFKKVLLWHIIGDEIKISFNNGKIRYCKRSEELENKLNEL